jgi:septal ring factor EnvC (AmiA/AmiB activator)
VIATRGKETDPTMRFRTITLALLLAGATPFAARALAAEEMCDSPPCTAEEIAAYERRVSRHLLRVQALRFEARARGDKDRHARLDKSVKRTQKRWEAAKQALAQAN